MSLPCVRSHSEPQLTVIMNLPGILNMHVMLYLFIRIMDPPDCRASLLTELHNSQALVITWMLPRCTWGLEKLGGGGVLWFTIFSKITLHYKIEKWWIQLVSISYQNIYSGCFFSKSTFSKTSYRNTIIIGFWSGPTFCQASSGSKLFLKIISRRH